MAVCMVFYFKQASNKKTDSPWNLVPANSLLVYETNQLFTNWQHIYSSNVWKLLQDIPDFRILEKRLTYLDTLLAENFTVEQRMFKVLAALLPVGSNKMDIIVFMQLDFQAMEKIEATFNNMKERKKFAFSQRSFQGFDLHEIKYKDQDFTYLIIDEVFVGSFTSFLIEDVIRQISTRGTKSFHDRHEDLLEIKKIQQDQGNLYMTRKGVTLLVEMFLQKNDFPQETFKNLLSGLVMDVAVNDQSILLNGNKSMRHDRDSSNFTHIFSGHSSQDIQVYPYLSTRTAVFLHYGYERPDHFLPSLNRYNTQNYPYITELRNKIEREYQFDFSLASDWIDKEICLAVLESVDPKNPERLAYVRTKDRSLALVHLEKLAKAKARQTGDSLITIQFSGVSIRYLNLVEFPMALLGKPFEGFDYCYFAPINQYVVFSNQLTTIKALIEDIETENVWSKSVKVNLFLENTLGKSNLSLMINMQRYWDIMQLQVFPYWRTYLSENHLAFKDIDLVSFQVENVDDHFLATASINFNKKEKKKPSHFEVAQQVYLSDPLVGFPYVVKNHENQSMEVLVQDTANRLSLISKTGKKLWEKELKQPIKGKVRQIDFYKNNKLQYLLPTENSLYLLDRKGNELQHYPIKMPDGATINHFSLIDYENNKQYRLIMADQAGNIFMKDQKGKGLTGWNPKSIGGPLACPVRHIRVKNRDCLLAVEQNGTVHAFTRSGTYFSGFPLRLETKTENKIFVQLDATLDNTLITTVSNGGKLIKFNLQGKIISINQLYRPTKEVRFTLIPDALKKSFILSRQDLSRVTLLNREGESLFEKEHITSESMKVQYYDFGSRVQIYAMTDQEQEFTYLYNAIGELINFRPIESTGPIGLLYYDSQSLFYAYAIYGNALSVYVFDRF